MTVSQTQPFAQVVSSLEELRNEAVAARNQLAAHYGHLPSEDPRLVTARHIKAVVSSSYLSALQLDEHMSRPDWWRHTFGEVPPAVTDELEDYATLIAANLAVFPISQFENGLRRLVWAMDPTACAGGNAEFKSICEWLFKRLVESGWSYAGGDPLVFLDVARNVRNTMHNNGSFMPRRPGNTSVVLNGVAHEFLVDAPPPFMGWGFHCANVKELIALNQAVMTTALVSSLSPISESATSSGGSAP